MAVSVCVCVCLFVCVFACPQEYLWKHTSGLYHVHVFVHVTYGRVSVLL